MAISGHTSGAVVVGVTSATTIIAGLAVISRLVTRIAIVRKTGIDDACISISMVRNPMYCVLPLDADTVKVLSIALTTTMTQQGNTTPASLRRLARADSRSSIWHGTTL
jgi:hypothetical protein